MIYLINMIAEKDEFNKNNLGSRTSVTGLREPQPTDNRCRKPNNLTTKQLST